MTDETSTPEPGAWAQHTHGGMTVGSNHETAESIKENFESEEKPLDGEPPDPEAEEKAKLAKAASELGKKGAEAKAAKPKEPEKPEKKAPEDDPEKAEAERQTRNRTTARERVEQATRESAELKRERSRLIQERDEARSRLNELKARPAAATAEDPEDPAPNETDYGDTPEETRRFIRDEARWAGRQEVKAREAARETKTREDEATKRRSDAQEAYEKHWTGLLDKHSGMLDEWHAEDPKFTEKLSAEIAGLVPSYVVHKEGGVVTPQNALADEILRSEHTKRMMLYLSQHHDVFQRIASLQSPRDIVREVAIIEQRLDAATPVPAKRAQSSKAPPPITPVSGSPTAADPNELSDDLPVDEWLRRRQAMGGR